MTVPSAVQQRGNERAAAKGKGPRLSAETRPLDARAAVLRRLLRPGHLDGRAKVARPGAGDFLAWSVPFDHLPICEGYGVRVSHRRGPRVYWGKASIGVGHRELVRDRRPVVPKGTEPILDLRLTVFLFDDHRAFARVAARTKDAGFEAGFAITDLVVIIEEAQVHLYTNARLSVDLRSAPLDLVFPFQVATIV